MNFDLKNCPFCGKEAMLFAGNGGVKVCCSYCGCSTQTFADSEDKEYTNAVRNAIASWNYRCNNSK